MGGRFSELAQYLFDHSTMEACSVEEIQSLVDRYPYFAPARFLLVEKLKQVDPEAYNHQLSKAILYYHNPLEFQWLIDAGRFHTSLRLPDESSQEVAEEKREPKPLVTEADLTSEPTDRFSSVEDTAPTPASVSSAEAALESPIAVEEVTPPHSDNFELAENEKEKPEDQTAVALTEKPAVSSNPLHAEKPAVNHADLAFEPFHTVDYFASQGIKLSVEETGKDKFGKQLRSFTEWLKTMKRLPPAALQSQTETQSEHKVKDMAEDSIHQSEVYTEAMAEVWTKQGNFARAAEVYQKLSLIHPSKKAYFAAKIENLKRN
jgi:hypothetical protein